MGKLEKMLDEMWANYQSECRDIEKDCAAEGKPSRGADYELRCSHVWEQYYRQDYEEISEQLAEMNEKAM